MTNLFSMILDFKIAFEFYIVLSKLKSYFPYEKYTIELLFKALILFGSIMIMVRSFFTYFGDTILHVFMMKYIIKNKGDDVLTSVPWFMWYQYL